MSKVSNVTEQEFQQHVLEADKPVLVDFYADWCGPCKSQAPILESLAEDNQDSLDVVKVDVDQAGGLAQMYGIRSIPTLVLFQNGKPVESRVGVNTKAQLTELIAEHS